MSPAHQSGDKGEGSRTLEKAMLRPTPTADRLRYRDATGLSAIELVVAMAILSIGLGTAISTLNASARILDSAAKEVSANLRLARAKAISTGYHYQVRVFSTYYNIDRMVLNAGNWVIDGGTPTQTVALPPLVTVTPVPSAAYEFDSRGGCVGATAPCLTAVSTIVLHHGPQNRDVLVNVWPSGQIY